MQNTKKGFGDVVPVLIAVVVGIVVAGVAIVIGAGISDQAVTVVKTVVTAPSSNFNSSVSAGSGLIVTGAQFAGIVVVALMGGLALYTLMRSLGGGMAR
jgi:hypothetical protein